MLSRWFFGILSTPCLCLLLQSQAGAHGQEASLADSLSGPLHVFREVRLLDQTGERFSPRRLMGKIVILNFIFTECSTTCPLQTMELSKIRESLPADLKDRVVFLSVSVDALHDTPLKLREYAKAFHADVPGWIFLTGTAGEVSQVVDAFNAAIGQGNGPAAARHTTDIRMFDSDGRLIQRYSGAPLDQPRLSREIQLLAALPRT